MRKQCEHNCEINFCSRPRIILHPYKNYNYYAGKWTIQGPSVHWLASNPHPWQSLSTQNNSTTLSAQLSLSTTPSAMSGGFVLRTGQYLPKDPAAVDNFVKDLIFKIYSTTDLKKIASMEEKSSKPLHTSVQKFKELIESDPAVYMYFTCMLTQVPPQYQQIPTYKVMLRLMNVIMTMAPPFSNSDLVGTPLNAVFLRPMATTAGTTAFLLDSVNKAMKEVLSSWAKYLESPISCDVLNTTDGWLSKEALDKMPQFEKTYVCNPTLPHWGFKSWDNFFTRRLKEGVRLAAQGKDIISNACESIPLSIAKNVEAKSEFWIKSQPYSMSFMLNNDPYVDTFVGGTVYQAFLRIFNYCRWHDWQVLCCRWVLLCWSSIWRLRWDRRH